MHESVLIYKIMDEVRPKIPQGLVLKKIALDVGEYSCVNSQSLLQLFEIAKVNTFAHHGRLDITAVKDDGDIKIMSIEVEHENRRKKRPVRNRKNACAN